MTFINVGDTSGINQSVIWLLGNTPVTVIGRVYVAHSPIRLQLSHFNVLVHLFTLNVADVSSSKLCLSFYLTRCGFYFGSFCIVASFFDEKASSTRTLV